MNYVGSISIIDRGDAPAKAVIDKNTRSLAQRVADETKEELDKVMDRVDNIYVSYEMSTQTMFENPRGSPNVEYIEDIKELEGIITDTVKKKKYQQQVTVFVVGFQDVCAQKMQLLQQVNQFFLDNSKLDEDEVTEEKPEVDLEEASNKVHESLSTAEELGRKLSDLNQDIIEWLVNYANTKASNKGKKRLEKSLESAKNELSDLSEKLLKLQTELEEKDEKFQQVAKQLEAKSQEVVRYKTAAEVAKKSAQDNEAHTSVLQEEITRRDEKIIELRTKLSRLEINLTESQFDKEMSSKKLDRTQAQTKVRFMTKVEIKEKLAKLQEEVDTKKIAVSDAEREMERLHREQMTNLHRAHQEEIEELKKDHEEEIVKLTEDLVTLQQQVKFAEFQAIEAAGQSEDLRAKLLDLELQDSPKDLIDDPISRGSSARLSGKSIAELSAGEDEHPSRQDSRQSNKDAKKRSETLKPSKTPSKSPNRIAKERSGKSSKDYADASIQDEGGDAGRAFVEKSNDPSRQATRQSKNLDTVVEGDGSEFPNAFDLDDEDSWAAIPPQQMAGRFLQFRQIGRSKIKELEDQLQVTLTKTHRKVNSLKSQFNEHKSKWETERKVLIEQVEQAQKLQTDAEKEADAAMTQLEEFINEQEKLEDEEEQKRQEIIKTISRPGTVKPATPEPTQQAGQPDEQGDRLHTENSEQELTNLMQQTDDAKAQKNARQTGAISAPPAVEPGDEQAAQKLKKDQEVSIEQPKHKSSKKVKSAVSPKGLQSTDDIEFKKGQEVSSEQQKHKSSKKVKPVVSPKGLQSTDDIEFKKGQEVSSEQQKHKSSKKVKPAVSPKGLQSTDEKEKEILANEMSAKSKDKSPDSLREFSFSGSVAADFLSSRPDSFSASLPRTLTSSEWRRLSPHDPFSPNAEKREKQKQIEKQEKEMKENEEKEIKTKSMSSMRSVLSEDFLGAETKMSTISVVISPKKKSRPVTMEQMLYGEGSLYVNPTGLDTAMDIIRDDSIIKSRSTQRSRTLNEKLELEKETLQGEKPVKNSDQSRRSSVSSHIPPRFSAKSKRSTQRSDTSAHSELPQPISPISLGRLSPATINRTSPVTINRSPRTSATPGTLVSDVQRPVSISSVQPRICESPPPDLHKYLPLQSHKETQTEDMLAQIEHEPVTGNTDDEVRQSSAKSRASLRHQFKSRLGETRQAVEERRTKSPSITIPAHKSIDDELIIEDDDDDDLPIPDDLKEEAFFREDTLDAGTSPPPDKQEAARKISLASRKSTNLAEHPVVQEFLRAYTGIHNFKEAMSRVLVDKDQMSASQILTDIDVLLFDKETKVVPQVSNMTENIYYVLNEVSQVINSVLQNDRGPVVSSLMMGMSRDATQRTIMREKSGVGDTHPETRGSQRTVSTKAGSTSTDTAQYQELQAQYEKFNFDVKITPKSVSLERQNQMSDESKKYEDQQRHNVVVMMEMQDTINQLQRELSALGKQTRRPPSESVSTAGAQNSDSAIMFTRLDSERNAKIMKKAVNDKKLESSRYKEVMVQMDEYVNLPAQRLAHLVRKYVHHCRMKEIEENVQKSQSLNENVFELFDKMEALQNQRAKRWADRMDEMGVERYRLANMLMETLDSIEQESGLFLIKPMYSYRGREPKEQSYSGKITRPFRPHRTLSPLRDNNSAHAPAPTPASNIRPRHQTRRDDMYQSQLAGQGQYVPKGPLEGDTTGLMGSSVGQMVGQPRSTWSMADSQLGLGNPMFGNVNTPRILELDINRMMIGQNTISAQIGSPGLSNDRLVNAANNNLRAYMTVNRPGPNSAGREDSPLSGSRQSPRPSSSPTNQSGSTAKRVRLSDVEIPTVMTTSQPLPPISNRDRPRSGSTKGTRSPPRIPVGNELPESPPGSSLRHSPPGMEETEVTSPVK